MLSTVLRILRCRPKLIQVNIRWARERCLNHLKQEGVYDVVEWEGDHGSGGGDKEGKGNRGTMERRPKILMVYERGIPLVGKPFSRRYKYTLPDDSSSKGKRRWPLGHAGGGVSGGRGGWRWGRKKKISENVGVDETAGAGVPVGVESVETESGIESETEIDTDTEIEVERDRRGDGEVLGEADIGTSLSVKGKEVKPGIGQAPTTN